jgi:hypothetical protein
MGKKKIRLEKYFLFYLFIVGIIMRKVDMENSKIFKKTIKNND